MAVETRLPSNPQQEFSMKTAAHSSVRRASPVPQWRTLHFAFLCGSWELFSHHSVVAINVTLGLSAAIGVIASIAVLVISCIRWKHM